MHTVEKNYKPAKAQSFQNDLLIVSVGLLALCDINTDATD